MCSAPWCTCTDYERLEEENEQLRQQLVDAAGAQAIRAAEIRLLRQAIAPFRNLMLAVRRPPDKPLEGDARYYPFSVNDERITDKQLEKLVQVMEWV